MDNLEDFGLVDDADIVLDEAALALALLDHDGIDVGPYEDVLSDIASRLDGIGVGVADASERGACLAQVLAGEFRFSGDADTYDDPDNADLIRVIDRLRGLPISLSILYVAAARRIGWAAKVTEATRQIVGAVAAALAVGIGLMAARVTSTASGNLIIPIMIVAAAYVSMVILSGLQFTWLQRDLRRGWQSRLYRYLPRSEYQALVLTPTGRAEASLFWVAGIGGFITLIISALVIFPKIWT